MRRRKFKKSRYGRKGNNYKRYKPKGRGSRIKRYGSSRGGIRL